MADDSSNPLGIPPSVWIVLAVGLAGVFAASHRPFQDARPADSTAPVYSHSPAENQDVEARQWEDPLGAVEIARDANDKRNQQTLEQKLLAKLAVPDAAAAPETNPPTVLAHSLTALHGQLVTGAGGADRVLVLGALVPGAPYADIIESRRRIRYSVLAGLFSLQFAPDNNEHIGYVSLQDINDLTAPHPNDLAAYEWFHYEGDEKINGSPRVLVLWLDQDGFRGQPLRHFSRLIHAVVDGAFDTTGRPASQINVKVAIVGPADSEGLKEMYQEIDALSDGDCRILGQPVRDLWIYSARATASDRWFLKDAGGLAVTFPHTSTRDAARDGTNADPADPDTNDEGTRKNMPASAVNARFTRACGCIHLIRTIASDRSVVGSLLEELKFRGVNDFSEIALVTERDTLYARLMSQYFNSCEGTSPMMSSGSAAQTGKPLCFTYLRGLDGLAPPAPDVNGTGGKSPATTSDVASSSHGAGVPEASIGQSQIDYLRRLEKSLADRVYGDGCPAGESSLAAGGTREVTAQRGVAGGPSEPARRPGCHHIKAIGVLGSDIYDKLLVLQALRSVFPRLIFFTTDLDARLVDAQNLVWTRELLVGSSLGLSLKPDLQRSLPPFRDDYQAAAYYSTMLAAQEVTNAAATPMPPAAAPLKAPETPLDTAPDLTWTRQPHVFDIGRNQPYDLTEGSDGNRACPDPARCEDIRLPQRRPPWSVLGIGSHVYVALGAICAALILTIAAMGLPWCRRLVLLEALPPHRRPGLRRRRRLRYRRKVAFQVLGVATVLVVASWDALILHLTNHGRRIPTPIFGGAGHWSGSVVELLSIVAVATLCIRAQRRLFDNAEQLRSEFALPTPTQELIRRHAKKIGKLPGPERWHERFWFPVKRLSEQPGRRLAAPKVSPLEAIIAQYLYRGRWRVRLARVAMATLVETLVLFFIEWLLKALQYDVGTSFVANFLADFYSIDRDVEGIISMANLVAIPFLVFWVSDAILLTRAFSLALAHEHPDWPTDSFTQDAAIASLSVPWATKWLNLRLMALRTGWVAELVWYPSVIIALMAISTLTVKFGEFGLAGNLLALALSTGCLVAAAMLLRRTAEEWRERVLSQLEDDKVAEYGRSTVLAARVSQLDILLDRTRELSTGAFAPYSQQPIVRAVLVPAITYAATSGLPLLHGP